MNPFYILYKFFDKTKFDEIRESLYLDMISVFTLQMKFNFYKSKIHRSQEHTF